MPGSFCMKVVQQGPKGFICKCEMLLLFFSVNNKIFNNFFLFYIGDGRWRQVIRRCASVSDTGVTGVCNWGVYENGVYWEECYCSHDACNNSNSIHQYKIYYIFFGFILLLHICTR